MRTLSHILGFLRIAVLSCLGLAAPVAAAEQAPLKLGIMPFNSPLALIKTHQPLTAHLERSLGRKVVVYTSPDYFTHINQLLAGDFDLAITGPHFGVMAAGRNMQLLFRYAVDLQPVFVVRQDASIRTPEDLRGKRVALSSRLSISSIGGIKWLQDKGFVLNRDFTVTEYSSHGAAVAAVVAGQADAAITTHTPLRQIPDDVRTRVQLLASDIRTPHLMTLAHRRLSSEEIQRIRQAIASFPGTPAGQAFLQETGYEAYTPVSKKDQESLQAFIDITLQMMR